MQCNAVKKTYTSQHYNKPIRIHFILIPEYLTLNESTTTISAYILGQTILLDSLTTTSQKKYILGLHLQNLSEIEATSTVRKL